MDKLFFNHLTGEFDLTDKYRYERPLPFAGFVSIVGDLSTIYDGSDPKSIYFATSHGTFVYYQNGEYYRAWRTSNEYTENKLPRARLYADSRGIVYYPAADGSLAETQLIFGDINNARYTFKVNNNIYAVNTGMNWAQWISSSDCPLNSYGEKFIIPEDGIVCLNSGYRSPLYPDSGDSSDFKMWIPYQEAFPIGNMQYYAHDIIQFSSSSKWATSNLFACLPHEPGYQFANGNIKPNEPKGVPAFGKETVGDPAYTWINRGISSIQFCTPNLSQWRDLFISHEIRHIPEISCLAVDTGHGEIIFPYGLYMVSEAIEVAINLNSSLKSYVELEQVITPADPNELRFVRPVIG